MISQSGNVAVNALGSRRGHRLPHRDLDRQPGGLRRQRLARGAERRARACARSRSSSSPTATASASPRALAGCAERGIGVVVLKVGSSEAGAGAAAAHTGALAGDQRVFRALIEESGACWARDPHELLELARVARRAARPADRDRRARGPDLLGRRLRASPPTRPSGSGSSCRRSARRPRRELDELLPEAATAGNPLDYTSLIWAERERLAAIVAAVGDDPAIDQLLIFHDTPEELAAEVEPGWRATRDGPRRRRRAVRPRPRSSPPPSPT